MKAILRNALAVAGVAFATQAAAQVTFYEHESFAGRSFTAQQRVDNFERSGFNDRASSVVVVGNTWEVCEHAQFQGHCMVLRPGRYPSLDSMGMNDRVSSVRAVGTNARIDDDRYAPAPVAAQVTFYEYEGFRGRTFTTQQRINNFERFGFNDRASSVEVLSERWEVCEDARFGGRCVVLRPGRYPSLASMGLNNRVSSVRAISTNARIDDNRYAPAPIAAQVIFYEDEGFRGRTFTTEEPIVNFERFGFNDRASSVQVLGAPWEVCEDTRFGGRCMVLRPGGYPTLASMGLNNRVSSVRAVNINARIDDNRYAPAPVAAQVTFYEHQGFRGRTFTTEEPVVNFQHFGFNDRASSVEVLGERWEVCENARFGGRCVVLRPGRYPSLASMGLTNRVSSVRAVSANARIDDNRYAPLPVAGRDYRRRNNERVYEANVTSVRAVVATPEQRCWTEREQISAERSNANIPAAIAGAIIGGILGHQVGGGSGKDLATAGGAVAGAAVGANIGRFGGVHQAQSKDVQKCANVPSEARPDYWDVTYDFRGQEYRVQLTAPPGPTITVNEQGEPRA